MCANCHNTFYHKSTLNCHVKNLHGAGRGTSKESKFARQRQSDLVRGDGSCNKNIHDKSETAPFGKFDFSNDEDTPFNPLPSKYGEYDDTHSESKTIKTLCLTTTICQTSKKSSCTTSYLK